jgi:hypothetical protein
MTYQQQNQSHQGKYGLGANFTPDFFIIVKSKYREHGVVRLPNTIRRTKYKFIVTKLAISGIAPEYSNDIISLCIDLPITPITSFADGSVNFVLDHIIPSSSRVFTINKNLNESDVR